MVCRCMQVLLWFPRPEDASQGLASLAELSEEPPPDPQLKPRKTQARAREIVPSIRTHSMRLTDCRMASSVGASISRVVTATPLPLALGAPPCASEVRAAVDCRLCGASRCLEDRVRRCCKTAAWLHLAPGASHVYVFRSSSNRPMLQIIF